MTKNKKIIVAMSGGVDSCATALLLKKQGYEPIGVTMKLIEDAGEGEQGSSCCGIDERLDARRVCEIIDIPFYSIDLSERFQKEVIDPFIDDYLHGLTPSPCVNCNSFLKFGELIDLAEDIEAEKVATGHYAHVEEYPKTGRLCIKKADYIPKDQSYFLFALNQAQLAKLSFPIGDMNKEAVRKICKEAGMPVHNKPESQEICFVTGTTAGKYVAEHADKKMPGGHIVDTNGKIMGRHEGIIHYTIGQRKGLGLSGGPFYVIKLDTENHQVIIGSEEELEASDMILNNVTWMGIDGSETFDCGVRIRYRHDPVMATVTPLENNRASVKFHSPAKAIAPGQAAVFYDEDYVLGGGWIE